MIAAWLWLACQPCIESPCTAGNVDARVRGPYPSELGNALAVQGDAVIAGATRFASPDVPRGRLHAFVGHYDRRSLRERGRWVGESTFDETGHAVAGHTLLDGQRLWAFGQPAHDTASTNGAVRLLHELPSGQEEADRVANLTVTGPYWAQLGNALAFVEHPELGLELWIGSYGHPPVSEEEDPTFRGRLYAVGVDERGTLGEGDVRRVIFGPGFGFARRFTTWDADRDGVDDLITITRPEVTDEALVAFRGPWVAARQEAPPPDGSWTLAPGSVFGDNLEATADLTGDGWPDLIVGAYTFDGPGQVMVLESGPDALGEGPLEERAWLVLTDEWAPSRLGVSLAAGDLDGDGAVDLVVGDAGPVRLAGFSTLGRILVFLGPLSAGTLTPADADIELFGPSYGAEFARALVLAPGDDGPDLFVGSPDAEGLRGEIVRISAARLLELAR